MSTTRVWSNEPDLEKAAAYRATSARLLREARDLEREAAAEVEQLRESAKRALSRAVELEIGITR